LLGTASSVLRSRQCGVITRWGASRARCNESFASYTIYHLMPQWRLKQHEEREKEGENKGKQQTGARALFEIRGCTLVSELVSNGVNGPCRMHTHIASIFWRFGTPSDSSQASALW